MTTISTFPILGIDVPAWLTSRVDEAGEIHFYLGAASSTQKVNLPSSLSLLAQWGEAQSIEIIPDVELASGMSDESQAARNEDNLYACSRCAVPARVPLQHQHSMPTTPLLVDRGSIQVAPVEPAVLRLDVKSIFDLAILRCSQNDLGATLRSKDLSLKSGDILSVIYSGSSCVVKLLDCIDATVFRVSLSRGMRDSLSPAGDCFVPGFSSMTKIGTFVKV